MADPARRDAVLVAGAMRAGVTSVVDRLRERMPDCRFVEEHELAPGDVAVAVVWVASATAPMTAAECARACAVAAHTDAVVAVVNKIDDHRRWRQVLAVNETGWPSAAWVAAAAAPRVGVPRIDDVVTTLVQQLSDPTLARRAGARVREAERAEHARRRIQVHQLRLELTSMVRHRCLAARAELLAEVSTMRTRGQVEERVRDRGREIRAEIEAELESQQAARVSPPVLSAPPPWRPSLPFPSGRRVETQLMVVLGLGFGVGVALVVARLMTTLAAGAGFTSVVAGVVGLAVTAWVVRARGLLHDRAQWERWTSDVVAALRIELEDAVAGRLLEVDTGRSAVEASRIDGFRGYRSVAGRPGPK